MNVGQLIKKLSALPKNLPVYYDGESGWERVRRVEQTGTEDSCVVLSETGLPSALVKGVTITEAIRGWFKTPSKT